MARARPGHPARRRRQVAVALSLSPFPLFPFPYFLSFLGFLGLATPNFLLALILLYLANVWFGTSIGGLMDPEYVAAATTWQSVGDSTGAWAGYGYQWWITATETGFPAYFALGYGGNGITFSVVAAQIIRDLFLGKGNSDAEIFRFGR